MPKAKNKGGKGARRFSVHFIRLASALDLARYLCDFTQVSMPIIALKEGSKYRLFAEGEKVGDTHIAYYVESPSISRYAVYTPPGPSQNEHLEMVDRHGEPDYKAYQMELVEFVSRPFSEKKIGRNEITYVRISDPRPLITALMHKGISNETIDKIYTFRHKGETFVGTFDLMSSRDDPQWFVYAKMDFEGEFGFFRYSSATDKAEPTNAPFDNQFFYVRAVNLAEAPPGFVPEGTKVR